MVIVPYEGARHYYAVTGIDHLRNLDLSMAIDPLAKPRKAEFVYLQFDPEPIKPAKAIKRAGRAGKGRRA